jgi:thiol:disulfide interchange protein
VAGTADGEDDGGPTWPVALLGAVLGGLLLNIMPCVFPILSLKALSLARAGETEAKARAEALAYAGGVIATCLALGGLLLVLRAGGASYGWAFQLQDPRVILLLLLLVTLTLQVASRFLFRFPLDWTEELGRVAQLWLVFIGAAVGARRAEHFVVDLFMQRVAFPGKQAVARLVDVLVVGFFLVLAAVGAQTAAFGAIPATGAPRAS